MASRRPFVGICRHLDDNVLVAVQMLMYFFNATSHKRSGLRSPVLASSTIRFAIILSTKLSVTRRDTRVISSATENPLDFGIAIELV